jgi:hypothetical protein
VNEKPSVFINVPSSFNDTSNATLFGNFQQQQQQNVLYVGVTLEKIDVLQNLEGTNLRRQQHEANSTVGLVQFIANDLFHYLQSFVRPSYQVLQQQPNQDVIVMPTNALDTWVNRFMHKLKVDPNFWKKVRTQT